MSLLAILLFFLLGFTLGKRSCRKPRPKPRKTSEISNLSNFLSYDGSEQTN
ncbi:MAG: hypothetical protein J6V50_03260 [Clostridia bacterium]|nr:hypothetical protein [Clostridia bacterium]